MQESAQQQSLSSQPETKSYAYNADKKPAKSRNYGILLLVALIIVFSVLAIVFINPLNSKPKPTVDPRLTGYTKLNAQANPNQLKELLNKVDAKSLPLDDPKNKEFYGYLSGFDNNHIQITGYNGIQNYSYTKDLIVSEVSSITTTPAPTSQPSKVDTIQSLPINKSVLLNKNNFGKLIQIALATDSSNLIQTITISK